MIYDIFIEHGAFGNFAGLKFVNLITNKVHSIDLSIDGSLGFGNLVSEAEEGVFVKGPSSSALVASVVDDYRGPFID